MEIPYEVTPRRDTGLYNSKLAVWLFLASEVMLFGGLFSAYVFLRLGVQEGVDTPWPWGLNVHKSFVWLGFINTLVLIASSVGVVFAWVALKERNWRQFQVLMYFVVGCAVIFMCIKSVEYHNKLTQHHGIKLVDNSVMEGKILDGTDKIRFTANEVAFKLQGSFPIFLQEIAKGEDFPKLTVKDAVDEDGNPVTVVLESKAEFKKWFVKARREVARELVKERKRYRADLASGVEYPKAVNVKTAATVTAEKPFKVNGNPTKIVAHDDQSLSYRDGSKATGELISDDVLFELHQVDMQLVIPTKQNDSIVWEVINDPAAKKSFFDQQHEAYVEMRDYYEPRGEVIPEKMLRGYQLNLQDVHIGHHGDDHHGDEHHGDEHHGDEHHGDAHGKDAEGHKANDGHHAKEEAHHDEKHAHGDEAGHDAHDSHDGAIVVPRDKIKFMGNHGPRYGNYYAIYFTMTALHGLHVVGGALVLLYFTLFGRKMFLKDPEHLANRVEVGGLFWHFVDLIWIFLFPIMYLL